MACVPLSCRSPFQPFNGTYVNQPQDRANLGPLRFALREMRAEFSSPRALAAMAGVALILAIAGPFETGLRLPFVPRLIYWLVLVVLTYGAGSIVGGLLIPPLLRRMGRTPTLLVAGTATGVAVCAVVIAINALAFNWLPEGWGEVWQLLALVVPVAVVVTFLLQLIPAPAPAEAQEAPPILDRLTLAARGALVSLSVEDHYVRIRTTKGEEMVLLRLGDAMREVGQTPGGQVHRSHWVAFGAVRDVRREGDRAILTMSHGPEIPVSRSNLPLLREAGLLPARRG